MRILACLLMLLTPLAAHAQASAAQCLSAFLSHDGDWQARAFDGRAVDENTFTPVTAVFVRNGHVHAALWKSEPTSARIKPAEGALLLKLFYPDVLPGVTDASASRLQPYARSEHRLVIRGPCKSPDAFTIQIVGEGRAHAVGFVRVPTSPTEFQEPASWDR